jgi:hypothetical protein
MHGLQNDEDSDIMHIDAGGIEIWEEVCAISAVGVRGLMVCSATFVCNIVNP